MAELNQQAGKPSSRRIRSRKLNARVDLTAMVDLAFLLITFFMLTTSLSKPQSMDLALPDKDATVEPTRFDENRTMTILIDKGNKIKCFMGMFSEGKPKEIAFSDLRKEIAASKKLAKAYGKANQKPTDLIVLIKPGNLSNYQNLIDVLDEMKISGIEKYAIADPDKQEIGLLASK